MFESLIVTLREGIEASLIVGILLAYLKQSEKQHLNLSVYWGVGLAVLFSIIGAIIFHKLTINEELFEGIIFLIAALFVGSMMIWMIRVAKSMKEHIHKKVDTLTGNSATKSIWTKAGWGILIFTFLMVFREGIETVLFLSAVSLTTDALLSFLGGILGLGFAIAFCVFFVKGTLRINLSKFFLITEIVLGIFIVQLIINSYHEFAEAGVLPATKQSMAIVGPVVRNNTLFLLAILIIPLLFVLIPNRTRKMEQIPDEGPERRKWLSRQKSERTWKYAMATLWIFIIAAISANHVQSSSPKQITAPQLVTPEKGEIRIPISQVNDGNLHRFGYVLDNITIRFLILKTGENKISTALDACEICGDYGYLQENQNILCLNCYAEIFSPTIGESGGCNPIPLPSLTENDFIIIHAADLLKNKSRFSHGILAETVDPVCLMKIQVTGTTPHLERNGKTYYFCSMANCISEFTKNPDKYIKN